MKKTILIAVAVCLFGLTGCGKDKDTVTGADGKKLSIEYPKEVSVAVGETSPVKVTVTRTKFDEDVTIEFAQLPDGVTVKEKETVIKKGSKESTFNLTATGSAKPGKGHAIKVSASGGGMKSGPHEVKVNITEKSAKADDKQKELQDWTKEQMTAINASIEKLQDKAKDAKDDAKVKLDKEIAELKVKRDELNTKLEGAAKTSAEAWDDFAKGVRKAASELRDATSKAVDRFKS